MIDSSGPASGRSAYVCPCEECIDRGVRRKNLERAFRQKVEEGELQVVREDLNCKLESKTKCIS